MKAQPTVDKIIKAQDLRPGMMLYEDDLPRLIVDVFPVDDYDEGVENTRLCVRLLNKALLLRPTSYCAVQEPVYDDPFAGL